LERQDVAYCKKTLSKEPALFEQEVAALQSLQSADHPHVLRLVASGSIRYGHKTNAIVTWPWCETAFLSFWQQPVDDVYLQLACIAFTFSFLHSKGIKYRDVKHTNMCYHKGSFVLLDYGGVTAFDSAASTRPDHFTRPYTCPDRTASSKADVFRLGLVFAQALLHYLQAGVGLDSLYDELGVSDWIETEVEGLLIRLREFGADCRLVNLIAHMLQAEKRLRPTADEVAATLFAESGKHPCRCQVLAAMGDPRPGLWMAPEEHICSPKERAIKRLKSELERSSAEKDAMRAEMDAMRAENDAMRAEMDVMREVQAKKDDEIGAIRAETAAIRAEMGAILEQVSSMQKKSKQNEK
jgi:serine/threonine protein kinase